MAKIKTPARRPIRAAVERPRPIAPIGKGAVTVRIDEAKLAEKMAEETVESARHSQVFELLDAVSEAKGALQGTAMVMGLVLDSNSAIEDGAIATLERWLNADLAALDNAFEAAWDGILKPMNPHNVEGAR